MSGCSVISDNALRARVFGEILVEECRPKSGDVGVGWGQRLKSNPHPTSTHSARVEGDSDPRA